MRRTPLPCLVLAALVFACGGSGERVREAHAHVAAGALELAESTLEGVEGEEAAALREEIARIRARRNALEIELAALLARADAASPNELRAALRELAARQRDPVARERVEKTLSDLTDQIAARGVTRVGGAASASSGASGQVPEPAAGPQGAADRLVAALRADVAEAISMGHWSRAQTLLDMLVDREESRTAELARQRQDIARGMGAEVDLLLGHAADLEEEQGLEAARELLERARERFPRSGVGLALHARIAEIERRQDALAAARGGGPTGGDPEVDAAEAAEVASADLPAGAGPEELARIAREREDADDLAGARAAWLAASKQLFPGDLRDDYVGAAQDLRARLELRGELAEAFARQPQIFERLGITAVGARGWTDSGTERAWSEIALDGLKRAAAMVEISPVARRGLICEGVRTRAPAEVERALVELARMVERGEIDAADGAGIVARSRGGLGAVERYQLARGRWLTKAEVDGEARAAELAKLKRVFERATGDEREAALAALDATGDDLAVHRALRDRSVAALKAIDRGRTLDDLRSLAELRGELDDARKAALDLIFDEDVYFYPYNPPEPPHTASEYARAQRRVDELVHAVRQVWERSRVVGLPKPFRAAIEELAWCRARCGERELPFALPERVPEWVLALPRELEETDLARFAWDAKEAAALDYSRKVVARNERLWEELEAKKGDGLDRAAYPDVAEREQVRITNAYRTLMGRRALAWNPRIQRAAQGHSDYMSRTGDFGHFEDDAQRRSPFDRMKLEGYARGVSENCAMVGGDPKSAHDGWLHSSGHHRNILMEGHREMASGLASLYWTQNFGTDTSFTGEL